MSRSAKNAEDPHDLIEASILRFDRSLGDELAIAYELPLPER